jgi:hypothetical protein
VSLLTQKSTSGADERAAPEQTDEQILTSVFWTYLRTVSGNGSIVTSSHEADLFQARLAISSLAREN